MAIVNPKTVPEGFKTTCCDCRDEITADTIKRGEYAHIVVRSKGPTDVPVLRCECCHEDYVERNCSCDD